MTDATTRIARHISEQWRDFKSISAHARFAVELSAVAAPKCRAMFVEACMPSWLVGSARGNPWTVAIHNLKQGDES